MSRKKTSGTGTFGNRGGVPWFFLVVMGVLLVIIYTNLKSKKIVNKTIRHHLSNKQQVVPEAETEKKQRDEKTRQFIFQYLGELKTRIKQNDRNYLGNHHRIARFIAEKNVLEACYRFEQIVKELNKLSGPNPDNRISELSQELFEGRNLCFARMAEKRTDWKICGQIRASGHPTENMRHGLALLKCFEQVAISAADIRGCEEMKRLGEKALSRTVAMDTNFRYQRCQSIVNTGTFNCTQYFKSQGKPKNDRSISVCWRQVAILTKSIEPCQKICDYPIYKCSHSESYGRSRKDYQRRFTRRDVCGCVRELRRLNENL